MGHSASASAYRALLPTNPMNAASHPRIDASSRFQRRFRLEDIASGFRILSRFRNVAPIVAKVMFTKWETMTALPRMFPLYPLNVSFGSVRAADQFQLGRNQ
jgi:hypothetical protein